jgi:hypothetical protein
MLKDCKTPEDFFGENGDRTIPSKEEPKSLRLFCLDCIPYKPYLTKILHKTPRRLLKNCYLIK